MRTLSWPCRSARIRWTSIRRSKPSVCGSGATISLPSFPRRAAAVAIARALAKNPKLLLCDEPTGALDYQTGKSILKLLQDTCREQQMTVIVITHNLALTPMGDKVIRVKSGKIRSIEVNEHPKPIEEIKW